jgi:hypothetical protein
MNRRKVEGSGLRRETRSRVVSWTTFTGRRAAMTEEKITTKTTEVRVEKHPGTAAKATVKKDGAGGSATAPTMQEAVDRAAEQSKK